jgi:hypothetical protein
MGYKLKGRIVTAILLSLLLFGAFSSFAEEKEKRFEVLFSGGASYATSRFGFSPGVTFSYYLRDNLALSFDFGVAFHIPHLDFLELIEWMDGYTIIIDAISHYRLFSSLSAEYSFDVSPRLKPFLAAGVGWCRDYAKFSLWVQELIWTEGIPFPLDGTITCSVYGDCKYRKSDFPLLILGGGIRCPVRENEVLKVMVRVMDPGGDSANYQIIAGWGFRF